jgi:uncharacterized protein (DUF488 family)
VNPVFTIGHSRHHPDKFIGLLIDAGVDVVVDVRSIPASRFAPWSGAKVVRKTLAAAGIDYLYLGKNLGGKPRDKKLQTDGRPDWDKIRAAPGFAAALDEIVRLAATKTQALMCAEADPDRCHRGLLLAPELAARGVSVIHLLADGGRLDHRPRATGQGPAGGVQRGLWS